MLTSELTRLSLLPILLLTAAAASAQPNGLLVKDGQPLFPIGCYELPADSAALETMANAGINIVHCHSREDLDRAQAAGLLGVFPLSLQQGATNELRDLVATVADHPALAIWEGPDEIVWNFTAFSGLYRTMGVHKTPGEWWRQTPEAVAYAEDQAAKIIPNMREAVAMIHGLESQPRPVWINEAQKSDTYYVRQYFDFVDITGCDCYPVDARKRNVAAMGEATDRWRDVGRNEKPVWMVLQAFSWNELGEYYGATESVYPTFAESRFMAYDCIAHGAKGLLYWGSNYLKSEPFRQSFYAVTRELAALQPFLTAPDVPEASLTLVELELAQRNGSVRCIARRAGEDWFVLLVNEDDVEHMGVVVGNLKSIEGRSLELLYGTESRTVTRGEIVVRMQPHEVKLYATSRQWEVTDRSGRDFGQAAE